MNTPENPPAFPRPVSYAERRDAEWQPSYSVPQEGMTRVSELGSIASRAYSVADAMLAERAKK